MTSVVSVFGVEPQRIGGTEAFARELSMQLATAERNSVLCFLHRPVGQVEKFLELPNVFLEPIADSTDFSYRTARNLSAILNRFRAEILHLHFTGFLGAYPWVGRFRSVRKVFFTDHSSRPAGHRILKAPLWRSLLARGINRPLTKVICVSDYGYRCMTGPELLPLERFQMIYNGVDLTRAFPDPLRAADFRRRYSIPQDRAVVVQVSWMIPEKGISELLQTARSVLSKTNKVQFVVVGEGAYREQFMKEARDLGIEDSVTWTGLVQDPFEEGVFDAADIVCQLSNWEEVFGWMIAEAMAYQKPVVATRVGGIPELVRDSISGFLVERGNIAGTAEKILLLLEKPELRQQMGAAGQLVAREKFDLRRNVEQLVKLYDLK